MTSEHPTRLPRRVLLQAGMTAPLATLLPARSRAAPDPHARVRRYVTLGRTGLSVSDISFGTSRLRAGSENLVAHALDRGINYFDTADSYTGGDSERVLGTALRGKRDRVVIASKTKAWSGSSADELMRSLEGSLRRLGTDYVDVYFNHAVNDVDRLANPEWYTFAERAREQGKIRYTGVSGHAGRLIECLDYAFDHDAVDVVLVAHNFGQDPEFYRRITRSFDFIARQPDLPRVLERAAKLNVGVVAMKTLMGARLNDMRPFERGPTTFAQAAFRWTLSNPHVHGLVISMTAEQDIDEYLGASGWQSLADGDLPLLERYASLNGATWCRQLCNDCEGACPFGVPIPDVLRTRMYATDYGDVEMARREYRGLAVSAAACLTCSGEPCRNACTHGLAIDRLCAPTHRMLA